MDEITHSAMFFLPCKSQELPISYQNALSIIFLKNKPCGFKIVFSILTSIFQNNPVSIPTVINPDLFRKVILHTISIRSNTKGRRRIRNDLENNYSKILMWKRNTLPLQSGIYLCRIYDRNPELTYWEPLEFDAERLIWKLPGHSGKTRYHVISWRRTNMFGGEKNESNCSKD